MSLSPLATILIDAVYKSSKIIMRDYEELSFLQSSQKGTHEFARRSKIMASKILQEDLTKAKPNYGMIIENDHKKGSEDYSFVISPLEGLENFSHTFPFYGTAVAVCKNSTNEILASIIQSPTLRETYVASAGNGAWLLNYADYSKGQSRLRVSQRKDIEDGLFALYPAQEFFPNRQLSSPNLELSYIAAGKLDGFSSRKLDFYQYAAGSLIVKESGGYFSSKDGLVVASNANFKDKLIS